jgi:dGTPase
VAEHLANYGEGLNLTYAVKDGILCHCGEDFATKQLRPATTPNKLEDIQSRRCLPTTYEGCIVRVADKIAYLGRDIEDAIKAKLITKKDIPLIVQDEIGTSNGEIINTLTLDLIEHSKDKDFIGFSPEKTDINLQLRDFNYERIYNNAQMRQRKETIDKRIADLFDYFRWIFDKYGFEYEAYKKETPRDSITTEKLRELWNKAVHIEGVSFEMPLPVHMKGVHLGVSHEYAL